LLLLLRLRYYLAAGSVFVLQPSRAAQPIFSVGLIFGFQLFATRAVMIVACAAAVQACSGYSQQS
jgi:hypothetical protein